MDTKRAIIWCAVSTGAQAEDDKFSLPKQEEDARTLCAQNAWDIIDVLRVPGHSRSYIDFHDLAAHASAEGIEAFNKLSQHWSERDFDVLILRDGERLARTQSLMAYIVEKTIQFGARLYSMSDGWVDENNFRMWISMAGYKASGDIDRLVKHFKNGMAERAKRGLPVSSKIPLSHMLIRDESGKALRLEVNEEKRRLWDDLAELILEGIAWKKIENELYTRYGHVAKDGRSYGMSYMYSLVTNPMFWGHTARGFKQHNTKQFRYGGLWLFDETVPVPDGMTLYRDTVPPVYSGEQAEQIKAELVRRHLIIKGKATANKTHRFTGLFVCAECGSGMGTVSHYKHRRKSIYQLGLRCNMIYVKQRNELFCHQRGYMPYKQIQAYFDALIRQLLDGISPEIFEDANCAPVDAQNRVEATRAELADTETRIAKLIYEQSAAPEVAQNFYRKQVSELASRVEVLRARLAQLERKVASVTQETTIQSATTAEIRELSLEAFWNQPDRYINQMLSRLLGSRQLVILDKQIIGAVERHKVRSRHRS